MMFPDHTSLRKYLYMILHNRMSLGIQVFYIKHIPIRRRFVCCLVRKDMDHFRLVFDKCPFYNLVFHKQLRYNHPVLENIQYKGVEAASWRVEAASWRVPEFPWRVPEFEWRVQEFSWRVPEFSWRVLEFSWRDLAFLKGTRTQSLDTSRH